jgi:hypothetical protein
LEQFCPIRMASKSYAPRNWARAAADLYLAMADGGSR